MVLAARDGLNRGGARVAASFTSPLHDQRTAAVLGLALGVAFSVCFLTGLISHVLQQPDGWYAWPSRPIWLYRVTQGAHVATGLASVPLLLAKLWTVYPHFWTFPPVRGVGHALERLSLLPLVGGSLFLLVTGVQNIARWYVWPFNFTAAHYAVAWITMGGLAVHIGAKVHTTREALRSPERSSPAVASDTGGLSRRGFIGAAGAAAAVITVTTIGQTVRPLRGISVLAPRDPGLGPQGVPVNKTAAGAGVVDAIRDPAYRLVVDGRGARIPLSLSLADLQAMPQREVTLPITCVEGWSATGRWRGVRLADVLDRAGAPAGRAARVESLQLRSRYRTSTLNARQAAHEDTLLALELNGEPLHVDHGYPVRLIAANRPGVLQTKWLSRLEIR